MPIFKRLILIQWLKFLAGAFITLLLLVTIATLISGFLRSSVTPQEVIINFILDLPVWTARILPLSCLVATLFSLNKLQRKSELIAILAGGFSRKKIISVIFQASVFVAIFQFINVSFLDPLTKSIRYKWSPDSLRKFRHDKNLGLKMSSLESGKIWFKSKNYFFSYVAFDKAINELKDVTIYYFNDNYKLQTTIMAKRAKYLKDNVWKLFDGQKHLSLSGTTFPQFTKFEVIETELNEQAKDFKEIDSDMKTLNIWSLFKFIYRIKKTGINTAEYEVMFYDKIANCLICIIFALIAIGAIYNPNRRSASFGKNVFYTFIFSIVYWLFYTFALTLGGSGKIPPILATFMIPVLFTSYIGFNFYKNRNLA